MVYLLTLSVPIKFGLSQLTQSAPRKADDLDFFNGNRAYSHAGRTYLNERSFNEKFESEIIIMIEVHQFDFSRSWQSERVNSQSPAPSLLLRDYLC